MKAKIITAWIGMLFLLLSRANAGGFQVNLLSTKASGMGHVGAGLYLDASILAINPGGGAFAQNSSLLGVANFIRARVTYAEVQPSTYTAQNSPTLSTPFAFHGNAKIGDKISAGLSVYTPFGSRVLYPDDWKGQFLLREISLKVFYFQPTFSYKVTDQLAIGAGPIISRGSVLLRRAIPAQFQDGTYGEANLEGSAGGFGFNAGIFWQPNEKWSLGASYRSAVNFKADEGQAQFQVPSALEEYFPNTTFSTNITLPAMTTLGIGYRPTPNIALGLDMNYVGWSVYDTLGFDFVENTANLADLASPREYKNSFYLRLGGQYSSGPADFRAGVYYDNTPVLSGYLTPETPDANKIGTSVGTSYRLGPIEMDLAFLWVEGQRRSDVNLETKFAGTYKARAFVSMVGIAYHLGKPKAID